MPILIERQRLERTTAPLAFFTSAFIIGPWIAVETLPSQIGEIGPERCTVSIRFVC